jgi:hypothetical protein
MRDNDISSILCYIEVLIACIVLKVNMFRHASSSKMCKVLFMQCNLGWIVVPVIKNSASPLLICESGKGGN